MQAGEIVDARKTAMPKADALKLASKVNEVYVSKGSKVVHIDLKNEKHSSDELAGYLLGPTGNLRAPSMIKGKTLVVGFDATVYKKVLTS